MEKDFDKLFGYNRQLYETFEYCNTIKNGSMTDKIWIQEQELKAPITIADEKKKETENVQVGKHANMIENKFTNKQDFNSADLGLSSVFSLLTPDTNNKEEQIPMKKKKKKPTWRLRK